jgi:short subunit dehydrogenase-like uncharacterized protein
LIASWEFTDGEAKHMAKDFLLYGANGYTGGLILERALREGARPILGGRNVAAVTQLAKRHGLRARAFEVSDEAAAVKALGGVRAVLNAAGPFHRTAVPMVRACLQTGAHYLDITGEIDVFETLAQQDKAARSAKIMLLPGVGFDVVPTDCLAAHLKSRLPDATTLALAFKGFGGFSRGTATTAVETMLTQGAVRRDGRIERVPPAWKTQTIDFGKGPRPAVTIPWGDVSTAFYSTGIGNVEVYMALPPTMIWQMQMTRYVGWFLQLPFLQDQLKAWLAAGSPGPDAQTRAKSSTVVWGEVTNPAGQRAAARLYMPNGYTLTAMTALRAAQNAAAGKAKPGFQTPSRAFGKDFVLEFDGVRREDIAD